MNNIREFVGFKDSYYKINREERNLSAILYHLLLSKDNLHKFLSLIGCPNISAKIDEIEIYFEYAFLRDLWNIIDNEDMNLKECNAKKRNLIYSFLKPNNFKTLEKMSNDEFNKYFGAVPEGKASNIIQSPSNWSVSRYWQNIVDDHEFLKVTKFKWAFNIKPDIVIHTSLNEAICIECKLESKEAYYPSVNTEAKIFKSRDIGKVPQTKIQEYLMNDLLGISTHFIYLVQKGESTSQSYDMLTWKDVLSKMCLDNSPKFIVNWIKSL